MIPQAYINSWRTHAPWALEAQVEQDLVISRALVDIFSSEFLSSKLAFRGGTALHKFYLNPPARYSEDIDLVQIQQESIGEVMSSLRHILDPWLGKPRYKQGEGRLTFIYRFESEIPPITPLKLKIEINTREHFSVLGFEKKEFEVDSLWFSNKANVTVYKLEELLGTKLRALYQRRKGRDLFDFVAVYRRIDVNWELVVKCFHYYMREAGLSVSKAEFEENMFYKFQNPLFLSDLDALISPLYKGNYTLEEGKAFFENILAPLLGP